MSSERSGERIVGVGHDFPERTLATQQQEKEVVGSFDWIGEFDDFQLLVTRSALGVSDNARMLVVGCGTSTLSEKLYHSGYREMVNIDIDKDQVDYMREQHQDKPTMLWETADVTDTSSLFPESGCFEVILDKGTLDALLCTDQGAEMLFEEWRLLAVGGVLVTISFRPADFISSLLSASDLPATLTSTAFFSEGRPAGTVFLLRKTQDSSPDRTTFKRCVDDSIQRWHQEAAPLLTAAREAAIRAAFAALPADPQGRVALKECHETLFGEEERGEYGYDMALFTDDLRAWREENAASGAASTRTPAEGEREGANGDGADEEREGDQACGEKGLTVEEALAFLREMQ